MTNFDIIRVLRTPHSERYLLHRDARDIAALDVHYLRSGKVDGTFTLFEDSGINESEIPEILAALDERILPDVSVAEQNLSFTVVVGRVLGAFKPDAPSK